MTHVFKTHQKAVTFFALLEFIQIHQWTGFFFFLKKKAKIILYTIDLGIKERKMRRAMFLMSESIFTFQTSGNILLKN